MGGSWDPTGVLHRLVLKRVPGLMLAMAASAFVASCGSRPLLPYSLDVPPLILAPIATAGVTDGRGRFREVYCAVRAKRGANLPYDRPCQEALVELADEPPPTGRPVRLGRPETPTRVAVVPGLAGQCLGAWVSPFSYALQHLESLGYKTELIPVADYGTSRDNGRQIRDHILTHMQDVQRERLILVGYSKGAADILAALAHHPEIANRVAAVVSVAGAVGGSPSADVVPSAFDRLRRAIAKMALDCPGDHRPALDDLRLSVRMRALAEARLPPTVRYFSIGAIADPGRVSTLLRGGYEHLSFIDPRNDGQMVFSQTIIPRGTLLGFVKADHWAIALPFSRQLPVLAATVIEHNAFPREVLLEAIVRMVEETLAEG